MKVVVAFISVVMLVSVIAGVNALEVNERAHMAGEMVGFPCGALCFLVPLWIPRVPMLFLFQPFIYDILSLLMNTVVKYITVFLVTTFYDLVGSVSPSNPESLFSYFSLLLSGLKGLLDGAWGPGRLSLWRIFLSPAGKIVNGMLTEISMEDYEASRVLATRGIPARNVEQSAEPPQ